MQCETVQQTCVVVHRWGKERKRGEWWNYKVKSAILQKRKVFEQWLQIRSEKAFDRYREERRKVKAVVRESKRKVEDTFRTNLGQNFEGNRKMFWKEVKRVWKGVQGEES